jgi:hypothetical protein
MRSTRLPYAEFDEKGNYRFNENGKRVELISLLTKIVADPSRPADERERAAEVLRFYSETVSGVANTPQSVIDSDITLAEMFGRLYADFMWYNPDDCLIRDWPQTDGCIHPLRSVVSKRFHGPRSAEPDPDPMPQPVPVAPAIAHSAVS